MKRLFTLATVVVMMAAPALAADHPVTLKDVKRTDGGFDVWLNNSLPGTTTVDFELSKLTNAAPSVYKKSVVVPAGARVLVATVYARDRRQAFNYRHRYWYQLGDLNARPAETVYRLPFKGVGASKIMQGYNGKFSHQNSKALDFALPVGTPIVAARSGVVIRSVASYTEGGATPDMLGKDNNIRILHDDGSVASYLHLAYKGVLVPVGKRVTAGQVIALSGNTGFSSAPHLHFEVRVPESGRKSRSIATPFRTTTASERGELLVQGRSYHAP